MAASNKYVSPLDDFVPNVSDPVLHSVSFVANLARSTIWCGVVRRIPHPSYEQWESVLSSSSPEDQLRLVDRASMAGTMNGVLK